MDSDTDAEGGGADPALAALEIHHDSQVVRLHENDGDLEAEASEAVLPVSRISPVPRLRPVDYTPKPLDWGGHGNVVAPAGVAFLDMVAGGER